MTEDIILNVYCPHCKLQVDFFTYPDYLYACVQCGNPYLVQEFKPNTWGFKR